MKHRIVRGLIFTMAFIVCGVAFSEDVWTVYPDSRIPEKNGEPIPGAGEMSGVQQLTNAFLSALYSATIRVMPGVYDLTGIAMSVDEASTGGRTYCVTNHLYRNESFTIVGVTDGHWDGAVVFKGNGRCIKANVWKANTVRNVTFEGFDAGGYPDVWNSPMSHGGAFLGRTDGNQYASNCVFRSCRAYVGGAMAAGKADDCLFTNCTSQAYGGATHSMVRIRGCRFADNCGGTHGGAVSRPTEVRDSLFERNVAGTSGGAIETSGGSVSNCTFNFNASKGNGGAVSVLYDEMNLTDCTFTGNVASNGVGGAFYTANSKCVVKGCTFVTNMTWSNSQQYQQWLGGAVSCGASESGMSAAPVGIFDCTFEGNYGGDYGGAVFNGACSNCTFTGNRALRRGAGIYYGSAVDCVFRDNGRLDPTGRDTYFHIEYGGNDAARSRLSRCDMDGGCYSYCALEDCRIHDLTNSRSFCVFWGQNWATNCLITGADGLTAGVFFRYGDNAAETGTVVNCTFADNELPYAGMYCTANSVRQNNYLILNSIFYNNTYNGDAADLRGSDVTSGPVYSNCLFGATSGTVGWTDAGGNQLGTNPKFLGPVAAARQGIDLYALRTSSPARDRGDATCFTATSTDLAGNPRLREGRLDLGCFQCWTQPMGFLLLFR